MKASLPINLKIMLVFSVLMGLHIPLLSLSQSLPKEIITTQPNSWRSATVFTHAIWQDLLFYGGGSGDSGGDPRHEIEIGVFHLIAPDSGYNHPNNPVVTRAQFGLDKPGQGIAPLSIFDRGDSLFMFCTSRPNDDLNPRIILISASVNDPYTWDNYRVIVDEAFSGKENNHGASALVNPDRLDSLLLYFAALSGKEDYRILLAEVPIADISDPAAYTLLNDYDNAVLQRTGAKTNYPYVRYDQERQEYELWYSGHTGYNAKTRSCFRTVSAHNDSFPPARQAVINPSGKSNRNDSAYATGPKVYQDHLYYSGRKEKNGTYRGIFYRYWKNRTSIIAKVSSEAVPDFRDIAKPSFEADLIRIDSTIRAKSNKTL